MERGGEGHGETAKIPVEPVLLTLKDAGVGIVIVGETRAPVGAESVVECFVDNVLALRVAAKERAIAQEPVSDAQAPSVTRCITIPGRERRSIIPTN